MFTLLPVVFVSGILTVLSPCVLPILPIILGSGIDGNKRRINGTIIGLVSSFTFFALTLSSLVSLLNISADTLRISAAIILGFFGISLIIPSLWEGIQGRIESVFHPPQLNTKGQGFFGGLLTGGVLGLVWTPCVGPIIATVTTLASLNSFSIQMILTVLAYSFGIGATLMAIAYAGSAISTQLGWYKKNLAKVRRWFGIIILLTAVAVGSGAERVFQTWVLDNLPANIADPVSQFEERFNLEEQLKPENQRGQLLKNAEGEVVNNVRLAIEEDGAKIPLDELLNGCPVRDCIPAIDDPEFNSVAESDWLEDEDRMFILTHNGITKMYAQRIMNWHEIVNDWYGEDPIAVTFCPLCGTATAFERTVDGVITQFGVSGKLHNSDLVMYDRFEGSLWQQVTGEAILGPAARRDEVLDPLFLIVLPWSEAKAQFPEAEVLTRDTGYSRDYNRYPYGAYESDGSIFFGVANEDARLHPKAWVYGVTVGETTKAYPEELVLAAGSFTDEVNGQTVEVSVENNIISFADENGAEIVPLRSFWFAWAAFNPDTEIYQ